MRLSPFLFSQNIATDNAINTIQCIHQLIAKINSVIDEVNSIDSKANDYTDSKITILRNSLESEISQLEHELKEYTISNVNSLNTDITNRISTIYATINNLRTELKSYSDINDSKLYVHIDEVYNELVDLIKKGNAIVYSPYDGQRKNVEDCLYDVARMIQFNTSLTLDEIEILASREMYVVGQGVVQVNVTWDSWIGHITDDNDYNSLDSFCYNTMNHLEYYFYDENEHGGIMERGELIINLNKQIFNV